ncbi:MAG: hypothetical protein HY047_10935 [Acidobacteria bacterium]|nr:hypothetical protein [Acidobacteriota bacterium]
MPDPPAILGRTFWGLTVVVIRRKAEWIGALGLIAVTVLPLIGCGSDRMPSPAAPSSVTAPTASLSSSVKASVSMGDNGGLSFATASDGTPSAVTVTSLVAGTSCPTLQFKIDSYVVQTTAATKYDGGTCASLKAGAKITLSGSRADDHEVFVATLITFHSDAPQTVEIEEVVSSVTGACPALRFVVGSTPVQVTTSTRYENGSCTDVKAGIRVEVTGTKQSDGSVTASKVVVPRTTTTTTHDETVEGEGVVTGLVSGTSCPTLNFLIGSYTVKVTAATTFSSGACGDIKVGSKVNLAGTRQADGSILVTRLALKPTTHAPEPVEGEATVTGVKAGTSCPALEFTLADRYVIKVSASTTYEGGACADIKVGTKVHVRGTVGTDGSVTASSVNIQGGETHHEEQAEGDGTVIGLVAGTACPTLKFQIRDYTIAVDASTEYVGGACTDIRSGVKVGVRGSVVADKSLTASRVTFKH